MDLRRRTNCRPWPSLRRGAATLLLSAVVAALLVVANQIVDTWTEGHLLMAWIVMWTIAFAALALLASPARNAGSVLRTAMRACPVTHQITTASCSFETHGMCETGSRGSRGGR